MTPATPVALWHAAAAERTAALARAGTPPGAQVASHACDVSGETQVQRFGDEPLAGHGGHGQ